MATDLLRSLQERGVLQPAQGTHVRHLWARARGGWPVARLVVDMGYADRNVVAECVVALHGGVRWDGRPPDFETTRRTAAARPRAARPLRIEDGTLVYASVDPGDGSDAEALCLASGARQTRHEIVTAVELARIEAQADPDRLRRLAGSNVEPRLLLGHALPAACVERGWAIRVCAGDAAELAHGEDLAQSIALSRSVASALIAQLRELGGIDADASWGVGGLGLVLDRERLADVEVQIAPTTRGPVGHARFAPSPLVARRADVVVSPALRAAQARVEAATGRAERDAALEELVAVTAVEPSADGSAIQDHLLALQSRVEHLRWMRRGHEAGELAARATELCALHAPAAAARFAGALIAARPRGARAPLLRAHAAALAPYDPLGAVQVLVDAMADLDPEAHADDVAAIAAEVAALELRALGGASMGTFEATRRVAVARATRGDPGADASTEEAASLARVLQREGGEGSAAYVRGAVRLAQGRPAEAAELFRSAMGLWAGIGWSAARWTAALDLARCWVALGRSADAREMVAAARASGELDDDGIEDAELVLRAAAGSAQPYR